MTENKATVGSGAYILKGSEVTPCRINKIGTKYIFVECISGPELFYTFNKKTLRIVTDKYRDKHIRLFLNIDVLDEARRRMRLEREYDKLIGHTWSHFPQHGGASSLTTVQLQDIVDTLTEAKQNRPMFDYTKKQLIAALRIFAALPTVRIPTNDEAGTRKREEAYKVVEACYTKVKIDEEYEKEKK